MGTERRTSLLALIVLFVLFFGACASAPPHPAAPTDRVSDLLARLDVAERWRRRWIIRDIAALGPQAAPQATPKLLQVLEHGEWDDRPAAAAALGWLSAAAAVPALTTALSAPDWRLVFSACRSLERLGKSSVSARAKLDELAGDHWLPKVRGAAAAAVLAVDGRPEPASAMDDDFSTWHPFKHECRPGSSGSGWQGAPPDGKRVEVAVADGILSGNDRGEFGGDVTFVGAHGAPQIVLANVNPLGFAKLGSNVVVVEGLAHLSLSEGKLWRLHPENGRWLAVPIAELPGAPRAFRETAAGGLEIDTRDGTVVVSATGAIQSVTCPSGPD